MNEKTHKYTNTKTCWCNSCQCKMPCLVGYDWKKERKIVACLKCDTVRYEDN